MLYAFKGLSRSVELPEGRLVEVLSAVLRDWRFLPLSRTGSGDPLIRLTEANGRYRLESPWQEGPPRDRNAVDAVCAFIVDLVHAFVADDPALLCLHCAAAEIGGRLVIVPAAYRSGKSILMASLAAAGTRVHADDVLPIKSPGDRAVAPGIAPRLRLPLGGEASPALRRFVAAHRGPASRSYQYLDLDPNHLARHGEEAPVGAFVTLERRADARTVLVPLSESEMLGKVILRNFARDVQATQILERLHALVAAAPCYKLIYSDVDRAVSLLRDVFRHWPERQRGAATDAARPVVIPAPTSQVGATTGCLTRTPGVREKAVGEALFLVDPDDQSIHQLSAVGAALWRLLAQPCRLDDAVDVLHQAFPKVEKARIQEDIRVLVAGLEKRGLVSTGAE
ncbi:MAG: PqqD family protein [Rhodospirillales bacterium]|nr:PqqD family protein [Rhodospirillales bacterium]